MSPETPTIPPKKPPLYNHDHEKDVIYFARTNYRRAMRKFGIRTDDRRRHTYVIGKTGMGKTTMLENMIIADMYYGHGCCYVDPHGDTAEKLIDYIPEWRKKDVVYFNPADTDFPMGFNILEVIDESKRHVIASGLMGVFKKIWPDVWSARMEHILNNCILTLLENPGNSLLGVNRLLVDRDFRRKMVAGLKDPVVRAFWITEFEQWQDKFRTEAIAPIQNKVGQFLSTSLVRNIVAQKTSTLNPREIMDSNKIFIVNLSKGRIGEDAMRLLGGMLITKFQLAAMERVDVPEDERSDFYLYIDEFQNFATESFANILSEARKYRLCLIMAHQFIEQLSEEVVAAVFGNVGSMISFRVGAPDAEKLEVEFSPRFLKEDLVALTKFDIYLRLMINGVASDPFSAVTLPPIAQSTHSEQEIIETSRELYGKPRAAVEDAILRWSEMGGEESNAAAPDVGAMFDEAEKQRKEAKKESRKPRNEYNCTRCNKLIVLPVELDRSRPIYCEECIEIVRAERKSGKQRKTETKAVKDAEKKVVEQAPKVNEGEVVQKSVGSEIKLSALSKPESKSAEKAPPVAINPAPKPAEKAEGIDFALPTVKPIDVKTAPAAVSPQPPQPAAAKPVVPASAPPPASPPPARLSGIAVAKPEVKPVVQSTEIKSQAEVKPASAPSAKPAEVVSPAAPAPSAAPSGEDPHKRKRKRHRKKGNGGQPQAPGTPASASSPRPAAPRPGGDDVFPW